MTTQATTGQRPQAVRSFIIAQGVIPVLLIIIVAAAAIIEPRFLSPTNIANILKQVSPLIIVALAQMLILLSGGFDLSVGTNISLVSVLTALALVRTPLGQDPTGIVAACALGLLVGALFGFVNGAAVSILQVSPFIVTLSTAAVGTGIALLITGGSPVINLPSGLQEVLGYGTLLGIPVPLIVAILAILLAYLLLSWTRWGRFIYAVGSNPRAAHTSGVPVRATLLLTYTLAGLFVGIAAVLLTARVSTGDSSLGEAYTMQSITAAVLGGISLGGGEGRVRDAVLGALFIAVLANGMDLVGISSFYQQIVLGVVLVAAVVFDRARHRLAARGGKA